MNMNESIHHLTWSLFDRNSDRQALNLSPRSILSEVARPWFDAYRHDPMIESALRDLNEDGARRVQALDFLGLDLVSAAA